MAFFKRGCTSAWWGACLLRSRPPFLASPFIAGVVVVVVVAGLAGCSTATTTPTTATTTRAPLVVATCGDTTVSIGADTSTSSVAHDVAVTATLMPEACAALTRWGLGWRRPARLTVHHSVDSFVDATGQTTDSLRAWTSWDQLHLLTLSSWTDQGRPAVVRRLTHEACHIGLLQRFVDEDQARKAHLPRALTEGICSVVADQGVDRLDKAAVQQALAGGRPMDFVDDSPFAYAVAHHVMAGIAACRGDAALLGLFDDVAAGATAAGALGRAPLAFLAGCDDGKEATDRPAR